MIAPAAPLPGLGRRLAWTRAVLLTEALWPALAPALGLAGLFLTLALLGLQAALAPAWRAGLLAITAGAMVGTAWRGLRGVVWPDRVAAARRLEAASGLTHRPLAVLADRPAGADPIAAALWQAHRARAVAVLAGLRVPMPRARRADRFGLIGGLAVALAAAAVIAGARAPERLEAAFAVSFGSAAPPAVLTAWITPPAYTGLAPLSLRRSRAALTVPAGSVLRVNLSGGAGRIHIGLGGTALATRKLGEDGARARLILTRSGLLAVRRGALSERWRLHVIPPRPPRLFWAARPGPLPADPRETRFAWRAQDAYGVTALAVRLRLDGRPLAQPRVLRLTAPPPPRAAGREVVQSGVALRDLTADPWAGLAVRARLVGRNGAALTGRGDRATFVLPARIFRNTLARRLIALRQFLSLHPEGREAVAASLSALDGVAFGAAYGDFLETGQDAVRLRQGAPVAAVQRSLWRVATDLEDRARSPAARRLARAHRAMDAALHRAAAHPTAANRAALAASLAALQRALAARLEALRPALAKAGLTPAEARRLARALAQVGASLTQQAGQAAAEGAMGRAAAATAALDRLLDQLTDSGQALAAAHQALAALQQAARQLAGMRRLLQGETRLLDRAHRRIGDDRTARTTPAPLTPPAGPVPGTRARAADLARQQSLRRTAGQMRATIPQTAVVAALTKARAAMARAAGALLAGQDPAAAAAERRAIAALRQGGQALSRQLARQAAALGHGGGMALPGLGALLPGGGGDPLGRAGNGEGMDPMATLGLPTDTAAQRSRAIEHTLRHRAAEPDRPAPERAYIRRLLRPF